MDRNNQKLIAKLRNINRNSLRKYEVERSNEMRSEMKLDPQFVNKHADSQLKIDLLFFWNRHPNAKFTLGAIARSLDCGRRDDLESAMEALVEAEFLEEHIQQGLPFYCLSSDSQKREPILGLSACGVGGWLRMSSQSRKQRIFRLMLEEAVSG